MRFKRQIAMLLVGAMLVSPMGNFTSYADIKTTTAQNLTTQTATAQTATANKTNSTTGEFRALNSQLKDAGIEIGDECYVQHDENKNDVYELKKNPDGDTTVYQWIFPTFTADKAWTRDCKFVDNVTTKSGGAKVPIGATSPDNYISVKPGEKYFIKTYGVGWTQDVSTGEIYHYVPLLFLDDNNNKITDMLYNAVSGSKQGVEFVVPENATRMHITMYNNQNFTLQKVLTLSSDEFDEIVIDKEKLMDTLQKNYEEYQQNQTLLRKPDKAYITFVNDDTRSEVDLFADIFTSKKVPLVLASIPENFMENASRQTETRLEAVQRIVAAGGEIMAHNGTPLTEDKFDDYNTMYAFFIKNLQMFNNYGFDVDGIILSGGQGLAPGRAEEELWASSIYAYSDLYGTEYKHTNVAMASAYYHWRGGLGNYKNDVEKIKSTIDSAIENKSWQVFYFHDTSEISAENLQIILDYVNSKSKDELEVVTYKQAYSKLAVREQELRDELRTTPTNITFTIDDSYKDALTMMKPIFDKYNIKGSVAIITDSVKQATNGQNNWYLTEDDLRTLYNGGWEILSHGLDACKSSSNQFMFREASENKVVSQRGYTVEQELVESKAYLESILGKGTVKGFAIPDLATLDEYTDDISQWYSYAIGQGSNDPNYSHQRTALSRMMYLSWRNEGTAQSQANAMIAQIDEAIYTRSDLNIYCHISYDFVNSINWSQYDCELEALDTVLQYISEKQATGECTISTPGQAYATGRTIPEHKATTYYVAANGKGDGLTSSTPMSYADAKSKKYISGDTILFKRGDTFYGSFSPYVMKINDEITTISAYGVGKMPVISGYKIVNKKAAWTSDNEGVYKIDLTDTNSFSGIMAVDSYTNNIGFLEDNNGVKYYSKKSSVEALEKEYDFYNDSQYLYIKCSTNPYDKLGVLKLATRTNLLLPRSNMKIMYLNILGTGAHGIVATNETTENITICNNVIEDIGGSFLTGTTRYGNGIEFYETNVRNAVIENNIIRNTYDVGFTIQGNKGSGKDVYVRNNVFVSNSQDSEVWESGAATGIVNYQFHNNISINQGRGWGYAARPNQYAAAHILFWGYRIDDNTDIYFHHNIVYNPRRIYFIEQTNGTNVVFKEKATIRSDYNKYIMDKNATIFRDSYKYDEREKFVEEYNSKDTNSTFELREFAENDAISQTADKSDDVYELAKLFNVKLTAPTDGKPVTFALSKTSYNYTGTVLKPIITIKDAQGNVIDKAEYRLSYSGACKLPGTYNVTIEFDGNYKLTKTLSYKIVMPVPTITEVENLAVGAKVSFGKVGVADGYYIYRKDTQAGSWHYVGTVAQPTTSIVSCIDKGVENGVVYYYAVKTYVNNPVGGETLKSISSGAKNTVYVKNVFVAQLSNPATRTIVIKTSSNSLATGYEIAYCPYSTFGPNTTKTVNIEVANNLSKTITNLNKNTTYYVKVRAKKVVAGYTFYSDWSLAKSIKIS